VCVKGNDLFSGLHCWNDGDTILFTGLELH
jgi:hypothetical protein